MVVLPSGQFTMGSPANERGGQDFERPQRSVTIPYTIAVSRFEITFAEWDACLADFGCNGYMPSDEGWGRGQRPVINISWYDAKSYVAWLKRKTGKAYRLLSEAEWEYAARARTTTPFSTGQAITSNQANFNGWVSYEGPPDPEGQYRGKTIAVGSFTANAFGLYDVHGNVWEWVEDCWNDGYSGVPTNGSADTTGDCGQRVLRGGSWDLDPEFLRSAGRYWIASVFQVDYIGFRVARTLAP
jgi:formylglycine-generating enzyme required for sulfatase activity